MQYARRAGGASTYHLSDRAWLQFHSLFRSAPLGTGPICSVPVAHAVTVLGGVLPMATRALGRARDDGMLHVRKLRKPGGAPLKHFFFFSCLRHFFLSTTSVLRRNLCPKFEFCCVKRSQMIDPRMARTFDNRGTDARSPGHTPAACAISHFLRCRVC